MTRVPLGFALGKSFRQRVIFDHISLVSSKYGYSISHSTLIFDAIKGLLGIYTLYISPDVPLRWNKNESARAWFVSLERLSSFFHTKWTKNALAPSFYLHIRANFLGTSAEIKKSMYPELALSGGKNECAVTDNVFFSISPVCTRGWPLNLIRM